MMLAVLVRVCTAIELFPLRANYNNILLSINLKLELKVFIIVFNSFIVSGTGGLKIGFKYFFSPNKTIFVCL